MEELPAPQRQQQSSSQQQQPLGRSLLGEEQQASDEKQQSSVLFSVHKQALEQWREQQQSSYDAVPAAAEVLPIENPRDGIRAGITADMGFMPYVFPTVRPPSPPASYPATATPFTAYSTGGGAEVKLAAAEGRSSVRSRPDEAAAFTSHVPASAPSCDPAAATSFATAAESAPSGAGHRNFLGDKTFRRANPAAVLACRPSALRSSSSDVLPLRAGAPRLRCSAAVSDPGTRASSSSSHADTSSRRYIVSAGFRAASHTALGCAAGCRISADFRALVASSRVAGGASRRIHHDALPHASAAAAASAAPTDYASYLTTRNKFNSRRTFSTSNLTSSSNSSLILSRSNSSPTIRSSKSSLIVCSNKSSLTNRSNNASFTTSSTNSSFTTGSTNVNLNVSGSNSTITPSNSNLLASVCNSSRGVRSSVTSVDSESACQETSRSGACSSGSSTSGSGDILLHKVPRPLSASVLKRLLEARRCRLRKTPLLRFLEGGSIDFEERRRKRGSGRKALSSQALSNSNKMLSGPSSNSAALSSRRTSGKPEDTSSAGGSPHLSWDSTTTCAAAAASITRTAAVEASAGVHAAVDIGTLEAGRGCGTMLAGCRTPINVFVYYAGDACRNRNTRSTAENGEVSAVVIGNAAAAGDAGNIGSDRKSKKNPSISSLSNTDIDNLRLRSVGSNHIQNGSCQGASSPIDGGANESSSSISTTRTLSATNTSRMQEQQQMKKHKKGEEASQHHPAAREKTPVRAAQCEDSLKWCGEQILQQMQVEPLLAAAALRARRYRPLFHQSVLADAASEALGPPAGVLQAAAARGGDTADDVRWSAAVSTQATATAAAGGPPTACGERPLVDMRRGTAAPAQNCNSAAAYTLIPDVRDWMAWRRWEDADLLPPPQELDELLTVLASAVKVRIAEVMALACGAEAAEHKESKSAFPTGAGAALETAAATVFTAAAEYSNSTGDVGGSDAAAATGISHTEHSHCLQRPTATAERTDNWHACAGTDPPVASASLGKSRRVLRLRHVLQAAAELPAVAALTPSLHATV